MYCTPWPPGYTCPPRNPPPANTTLLLLTTRPYALLPTIRSRVLHFRFPAPAPVVA